MSKDHATSNEQLSRLERSTEYFGKDRDQLREIILARDEEIAQLSDTLQDAREVNYESEVAGLCAENKRLREANDALNAECMRLGALKEPASPSETSGVDPRVPDLVKRLDHDSARQYGLNPSERTLTINGREWEWLKAAMPPGEATTAARIEHSCPNCGAHLLTESSPDEEATAYTEEVHEIRQSQLQEAHRAVWEMFQDGWCSFGPEGMSEPQRLVSDYTRKYPEGSPEEPTGETSRDDLAAECEGYAEWVTVPLAACGALKRAAAALRAVDSDAERYRYLKSHLGLGWGVKLAGADPHGFAGPSLLDKALDAARGAVEPSPRMDGYTCRKCGVWYAGPNGFHKCSAP